MNLKELREKKGISQKQLSEICSVDRTTVNKWESGASYPSAQMLIMLSDYFECSVDRILGLHDADGTAVANGTNCTAAAGNAHVMLNQSASDAGMESDFLEIFRKLDLRSKAKLITHAYELLESTTKEKRD